MRQSAGLLLLCASVGVLAQHSGLAAAADAGRNKRTGTSWQGFTTRHRIKHGNPYSYSKEGEEHHQRKWYEPAHAEYKMGKNTVFQYVTTLVVFAVPVTALFICARKTRPESWLGRACLVSEQAQADGPRRWHPPKTPLM